MSSSYKRSRATFEAEQHAPYAVFGTPLPNESDGRDDGSYLPLWKQDVRDQRGRKRLHGAFTGGWSAGYFNTVGSKEGWTPSTFLSSRSNRNKIDERTIQQRAQDFMDEEDLADAAEAQQLKTSEAFAGFGSSADEKAHALGLTGLLRVQGDTMGLKLLRRMGWKDGQGIGPKVRREARLESTVATEGSDTTYLFAPDDTNMIAFMRKKDRRGLGFQGETKLGQAKADIGSEDQDKDEFLNPRKLSATGSKTKTNQKAKRGGMGVGILNDNGSDDEDPYEMGPKISYNRLLGGDKKKKKKASAVANPSLGSAPVFLSKVARSSGSLRRCHDGRLPLDGFVLAKAVDHLTSLLSKYTPLTPPEGWTSSKSMGDSLVQGDVVYKSAADAAKESKLDAKARAIILGEKALPGKSVFDFLSPATRNKLAEASGRSNLPPGLGQVPAEYALTQDEKLKALLDQVPTMDKETAIAAIARGSSGPYSDDESKRNRYRAYLEHSANRDRPLPAKPVSMTDDDYLREMTEFYNCARIFKPMTGFMASRFTTAKTVMHAGTGAPDAKATADLVTQLEPKPADPADEAAKVGMYGKLTRSVQDFYPSRLLCKRFNVKPPAHARPDGGTDGSRTAATASGGGHEASQEPAGAALLLTLGSASGTGQEAQGEAKPVPVRIDPEKNDAVEADAAGHDLLKAIFGDDDDDDDDD